MTQLRQGDILLISVHELPPGAGPVVPVERGGRLCRVIAEGEATDHAHVLVADEHAGFYRSSEPQRELTTGYVTVRGGGVVLEHEEHADLTVPAGLYRVVRQREHEPAARRWAHVRD